ncbi:MAG: 16S rRNA (cytosine(1402)-N(4))-methyltransferase RsmH [Pseudomonadota bacterium]
MPSTAEWHVDATFGGGGYAEALLAAGIARLTVVDRDPAAVARARRLAAGDPRVDVVEGAFGALDRLVAGPVDGIVFDLGVSSFQLDEPERGFSFRADGPLDMRMGGEGATAAELVNGLVEAELARIFFDYGEERRARRAARAIVRRRAVRPFERTVDLADVVRGAVGGSATRVDPATRVFQALRIAVNDELGQLEGALPRAVDLLAPRGRIVVVAFHSLEDRIVKRCFAAAAGRVAGVSRHLPEAEAPAPARLELLTRRVVTPSEAECRANPRARSARLRAAKRLAN